MTMIMVRIGTTHTLRESEVDRIVSTTVGRTVGRTVDSTVDRTVDRTVLIIKMAN